MPPRYLALASALTTILSAVGLGGQTQPLADSPISGTRPNIVFVLTDDQRLDDMRAMPKTKKLLGDQGVTFENAFATTPLCCPARTTLFTGQYSHNHGVWHNRPPHGGISAFTHPEMSVPVWLKAQGYKTYFMGKFLNGAAPESAEPGWDEFWLPSGGERYAMQDYQLKRNGIVQPHFYGESESAYRANVFSRLGQKFINQAAATPDPFLLWVADVAPHTNNKAPAGEPNPLPEKKYRGTWRKKSLQRTRAFRDRSVKDRASANQMKPFSRTKQDQAEDLWRDRIESLRSIDDQVSHLYHELEATGELENTIFIFTSDNGYMLGEHGLYAKGKPQEESVRVPLLIRGPGFPAGQKRDDLVALHDITATMVDAAGATADRVLDGHSLLSDVRRNQIMLECLACNREQVWHELHTRKEVYFEYANGQAEYYDLSKDPKQLKNGYDKNRARAQAMGRRLEQIKNCAGAACP